MNQKDILRENLLALLTGEHARMSFDDTVREFPIDRINENFPNADYTPWDLLEHIRLTQQDILDFIINPDYKYRKWPQDYWPKKGKKASRADWEKTISGFKKDFKELENIAKNPKTDLYQDIPWGEGETILREFVTVANHNAFHIGEFAIMRQAMGTWSKSHKK
ncbi:MAG: DinB family protein [Chloroflexi bacterium]|nr:DinB family protein [Chloroflexota bacterium]